jgi:hypothetical protein
MSIAGPKLIVPIYSMRSYKTGKYSILKDGNFKLQINRMDWSKDILIIPENTSDLDEFIDLDILPIDQIKTAVYGENAYETRKMFWIKNQEKLDWYGLPIVTDITGYTGKNSFVNNFNITKDPEVSRFYIDEFIDIDVESIKRAENTTVLNHGQKEYLLSLDSTLNIEVNQKVISKQYFDKVGIEYPFPSPSFDIFFPFRLSDSAYKFEETVFKHEQETILITDPNDSYQDQFKNVIKKRFTKREFYGIISTRPRIIYNENPNKIFHPGLADFIYFGCDIECPYSLPRLKDVLI